MKASRQFVDTLASGIRLLVNKYGADAVNGAKDWTLFFAVADSVTPGHEHNARVSMPTDEGFAKELRTLNDAHIVTAIKAARKQAQQ